MHLGKMDKVFVVKRGILGVKSRNDGGVHGTWHCYCGVELRENWSIGEVQIVQNEGGVGMLSRTDGKSSPIWSSNLRVIYE